MSVIRSTMARRGSDCESTIHILLENTNTSLSNENSIGSTTADVSNNADLIFMSNVNVTACRIDTDHQESVVIIPCNGSESLPRVGKIDGSSTVISTRKTFDSVAGLPWEPWHKLLRDISLPFFIAGIGMVGAGVLLDYVLEWDVYKDLPELLILVTPLLGLKGDLEMTLASRLSTHSNIGNMDESKKKWRICLGNLALDQIQAIVCGLGAGCFALLINLIYHGKCPLNHVLLIGSTSMLTASMASLILGSLMVFVILISRKCHVNPDNIATPLAGSLGDIVTLFMLTMFSSALWNWIQDGKEWIPCFLFGIYVPVVLLSATYVSRNEYVKHIFVTGWVPVILSVGISTVGGIILEFAEKRFHKLPLYQPLINGIGGNLASVQASRISTHMHSEFEYKTLPQRTCESPWSIYFNGVHATSARILLLLVIPGDLVFVTISWSVSVWRQGPENTGVYDLVFLVIFVLAALIQVSILLYLAKIVCNFAWIRGMDPDTNAIPYLTALGDLIGTGILYLVFLIYN